MTYNHDYKEDLFMPYGLSNVYKEVIIKERVWIGINVNITIGCVVNDASNAIKHELININNVGICSI